MSNILISIIYVACASCMNPLRGVLCTYPTVSTVTAKHYVADTLNGEVKRYSNSGIILEVAYYVKGVKHGPSTLYYKNGNIYETSTYIDGKIDGLCKQYDLKGSVTKEIYFTLGIFNGRWVKYINGKKSVEANFSQGLINGWYYDFYKTGSICHKTFYNMGKIVTGERVYRKDGTLKYELISNKINNRLVMRVNYDKKGNVLERKSIEDKPVAYYVFGEDVFLMQ